MYKKKETKKQKRGSGRIQLDNYVYIRIYFYSLQPSNAMRVLHFWGAFVYNLNARFEKGIKIEHALIQLQKPGTEEFESTANRNPIYIL